MHCRPVALVWYANNRPQVGRCFPIYTLVCTLWDDVYPAKVRDYQITMTQSSTIKESDSQTIEEFPELTMGASARYQIRVRGNLDGSWSEKLGGLKIETTMETAMTVLTGPLADQAALSGVLNTLYDLQLPVISVEHLPSANDQK